MHGLDAGGDWEIVWEQSSDVAADLVVSLLQGSGIPVVRLPPATAPTVLDGAGGPLMTVRVLVPQVHAAEARELLDDAESGALAAEEGPAGE